MSDDTQDMTADEREYTLDELSKLANVTPRTVRYYIAEDLLPPPIVGGRNATYSQDHLDRLNAIGAMKDMYLPLREIRHRLNTLTLEQMRDPSYLASLAQAAAMDRAMNKRQMARSRGMAARTEAESAAEYLDRVEHRQEIRSNHPMGEPRRGRRMAPQAEAMMPDSPASTSWERFPLGDDAELMMRSSKVQSMGPRLHRMLHRLRHMIESEERERNRS